jgi:hypothetical protein
VAVRANSASCLASWKRRENGIRTQKFGELTSLDRFSTTRLARDLVVESGDEMSAKCCVAWMVCFLLVVGSSPVMAEEAADWPDEPAESSFESWDRLGMEEATNLSRAELVVFQTIHGTVLGFQACLLIECRSPRSYVGLPALGGLAGLGASLYFTQNGIAPGMTASLNSGVVWGGWMGIWTANLARWWDETIAGSMMVGQVLGMGLGYGMAEVLRPTSGDVAAVNHTAIWTTVSYFIIVEILLGLQASDQAQAASMMIVPALGAAGGGALAANYPMSRPRVRVVSAAGLVGGLLGATAVFLIFEDRIQEEVMATASLLGIFSGLGVAGYLTRGWDSEYREGPDMSATVVPTMDGRGLQLSLTGRF